MPITVATTILKPGGYERFRQLAEETEDLMKNKYEGIDYEKLAKVVANIPNERRNHKLYREKAGNRKTDSELPLFDYYKAPCKTTRSEERRVGKECRSRWSPYH